MFYLYRVFIDKIFKEDGFLNIGGYTIDDVVFYKKINSLSYHSTKEYIYSKYGLCSNGWCHSYCKDISKNELYLLIDLDLEVLIKIDSYYILSEILKY